MFEKKGFYYHAFSSRWQLKTITPSWNLSEHKEHSCSKNLREMTKTKGTMTKQILPSLGSDVNNLPAGLFVHISFVCLFGTYGYTIWGVLFLSLIYTQAFLNRLYHFYNH